MLTEKYGSPEYIQKSRDKKQIISGILTASTALIGLKIGGDIGGGLTHFSTTVGDIPVNYKRSISLNWPYEYDFSKFKNIDVRKVYDSLTPKIFGQIIIAYKQEKTPEIENAAMVKALPALVGVGLTRQDIDKARQEDLERRNQIWQKCVAENRCKEPS